MSNVDELDEDAFFDQAVDDAPAEPVAEPTPEPEPEPQPEPDAQLTPEPQADKPAVDDNAPQVPSWRVREINEEKRQMAAELEALRAERAQWQARQQQQPPQAQQPQPEKAAKPDPLLDPEGYANAVRDEIREEIIAERRESSLHAAHAKYTIEFEEAYAAAQKAVDPALKARMQASRDPGETLIQWHREQKTRQEIGGDLTAYKQRLREEALKDPEFRKAAMAAWQAEAQPQQNNGRPRVELPPSLNGASRSNAALRASQADLSDDALWEEATA
jgi:hypothetical protein